MKRKKYEDCILTYKDQNEDYILSFVRATQVSLKSKHFQDCIELKLSGLSLEAGKMVAHFYFMPDYRALQLEKAENKCKKETHWNLVRNNSSLKFQRLFCMCVKMNNQNK